MNIQWICCHSYQEARNYRNIIYLHEWDGKPFYWGKAHNSYFGGHMRRIDGFTASGRYNSGYKHWIEGCLRHGASLYVGKLPDTGVHTIDEIENFLISTFPSEMNSRIKTVISPVNITHSGEVPRSISGLS